MRCVLFLLVLISAMIGATEPAFSQSPLAFFGSHFSFGIIEGDENLPSVSTPSVVTLTIISPYSGNGTIRSPGGFFQPFSFSAMKDTGIGSIRIHNILFVL